MLRSMIFRTFAAEFINIISLTINQSVWQI